DPDVSTVGSYWIFRDQNDFMIFDRGPAGAQTLPAHAHCDLLTFEASLGGARWIVDSGLYNYSDDPMRWYCRSSLAHNVVTVDDQNQNDVWSKFRMGYRGEPSRLMHGRDGDFCWGQASHDGFRRHGVERIDRLIGISKSKFWYCLDRISPTNKDVSGFIHLGPEVRVTQISEYQYQLKCSDKENQICFVGCSEIKVINGWYCPEFGKRQRNPVFEYRFSSVENTTKPRIAGWWIQPGAKGDQTSQLEFAANHQVAETKITLSSNPDSQLESSESNAGIGDLHTFNWKQQ
ncbi:MAG: heparinase II/III-family protein, partial [Mariniblastus sp.]